MGNLYTRLVGELALEFNQFRTKTNVPKLLGPEVISKVSQQLGFIDKKAKMQG